MASSHYVGKLDFKRNIRLLVIHPVKPASGIEGPTQLPGYDYLLDATTVDAVSCKDAPASIYTKDDCAAASPFVVEKSRWAESKDYDAVVVNCMLDPGVVEARRAVNIPVIGLREATLALSSVVGDKPAVIYPENIPVLELADDESRTFNELVKIGTEKMERGNADVLILGCSYLGGLAQRLQGELNVPVLANLDLGLRVAECLAAFRILPGSVK